MLRQVTIGGNTYLVANDTYPVGSGSTSLFEALAATSGPPSIVPPGAVDAGPIINSAISSARGRIRLPSGSYVLNTTINGTGKAGLIIEGDGRSTKLFGRCAGRPMFDLTGSMWVTLRDMWIEGVQSSMPSCGVLAGRVADNVSAGGHNFDSLHMTGYFGVADYVGISSEENNHHGNFSYENFQVGAACAAVCTNNLWPTTLFSQYAVLKNNPLGGNTVHSFIGGRMGMDTPASDHSSTTLVLEGVRGLTMQGTFLYGPGSKGIWICGSGASFMNLIGASEDEVTTDFGIYIEAGSVCESVVIDGYLGGGPIYGADGSVVTNSRIHGRWSANGRPFNIDLDAVKNSVIDASGLNTRVRTEAKATDFGNFVQTISLPVNSAGCRYVHFDGTSYTLVTN